jgi:hypothetical protein
MSGGAAFDGGAGRPPGAFTSHMTWAAGNRGLFFRGADRRIEMGCAARVGMLIPASPSCRICYHPPMTPGRIAALLIFFGLALFLLFGLPEMMR